MPWLYSGPDDNVCRLRGVGVGDDDAPADDAGGPSAAAPPVSRFWDGSRDRWVAVVSTRVEPDVVTSQLGQLPRHEVELPRSVVDEESENNAKMMREYLEMEQALAGEKDDNPWAWVRKRLIGVRGYKPWFGHLFTKDQQEMRYRDIHADLRAVREQIEKESKDKLKEAKGTLNGGAAGGLCGVKGKGSMEAKRPAYAEMDPMRRAHLFGVSIQAHVVPPWARQDGEELVRGAADSTSGAASGDGPSLVKHAAQHGSAEVGAHSRAEAGMTKGAKKRKPGTQKQASSGDGKMQKVGASGKGSRSTRDRAFQQLFASTEQSEVALRIKYEEACRRGTVEAMLDGKMHPRGGPLLADENPAEARAGGGAVKHGLEGAVATGVIHKDEAHAEQDSANTKGEPSLAEKLKARARGHVADPAHSGKFSLSANGAPTIGGSGALKTEVGAIASTPAVREANSGQGGLKESAEAQRSQCGADGCGTSEVEKTDDSRGQSEKQGAVAVPVSNSGSVPGSSSASAGGHFGSFMLSDAAGPDLGFALSSPTKA